MSWTSNKWLSWAVVGLALSLGRSFAQPVIHTGLVGDWLLSIQIVTPAPGRDVNADLFQVESQLGNRWHQLSRQESGSEISQVNALAGLRSGRLSRPVYDAILRSLQWKDKTQGAVDLLAGPLQRWAQAGGASPAPDSVLALVRDGGAYFVDLGVLLRSPGMELDLDPLAEGLLVDLALDTLVGMGHRGVSVELGGVTRLPATPSQASSTDLSLPCRNWVLGVLGYSGRALASQSTYCDVGRGSGLSAPILDPRSGRLVSTEAGDETGGCATWVLAPTGEEARVWALALAILGPDEGGRLLAGQANVDWGYARVGPNTPDRPGSEAVLEWRHSPGFVMTGPARALDSIPESTGP